MQRRRERRGFRPLLEHASRIKDAGAVADAIHHTEVVRDEQHRQSAAAPQRIEQVEDLRLDGDVERGRRLIENEQLGIADQRLRDQHALLHAAAQLMRIGLQQLVGTRKPDFRKRGPRFRQGFAQTKSAMVDEWLRDLLADRQRRVERCERILEHDAEAAAAQRAQFGLRHREQVAAIEEDAPRGDPRLRPKQPEHRERDRALARAGLADQRERLALADCE